MRRSFETAEEFENIFQNYVKECEEKRKLPNVAGFCAFARINRDTFYAQKQYYSDTFNYVNEVLEDSAINTKEVNDTFKIFYMKNKFDYKDRQEIDADVNQKIIRVTLDDDEE